jgi:hypothetical protein
MVREIDRAMVLRIETKEGKEKEQAIALRNITIPLVIFMLEHQFCSTVGKEGEKTVWRQMTGISIGSSCSGILANLTLLMGEIDMLDRLEAKGIVLSTYNRYVDDITVVSDVREKKEKGKLFLILEDELNKLDPVGNSIRVTGEQIYADRVNNQLEKDQGLAYLDLWQKLVRGTLGQIRIECGIYRKKAAADMYILPSSAHSKKLRLGVIRGEYLRYLTLCSTEEGYNEACERLRKALETRGYNKNEIQGEKDRVLWDSKQEVIRKREERGKNSAKSKAGPPGIPVVVPDKQGLREWWEQCTRQSITENFGEYLTNAEMEMLPSRMFKCLSRTESTGDFIKRNRKNKYRDKRGQK